MCLYKTVNRHDATQMLLTTICEHTNGKSHDIAVSSVIYSETLFISRLCVLSVKLLLHVGQYTRRPLKD